MKKYLLSLLLIIFLISSLSVKDGKTGWKNYNRKGSVKIETIKSYNIIIKSKTFEKKLKLKTVINYDKNGYIIDKNEYNEDQTLKCFYIYSCDEKKNLTSIDLYNPDGSLKLNISKFKYDDKENMIESKTAYEYGFITITKYDDKGNLLEFNIYDSKGILTSKQKTIWDSSGIIIGSYYYNSENILEYSSKYKYDDKGNLMEETHFKSDGSLINLVKPKYDDKKKEIERFVYNSNGILKENTKYESDNRGNLIEKRYYYSDRRFENKYTFKYDEKGNLIEYIVYYSEFDFKTNQYELKSIYTYEEHEYIYY